MVLYVEDLLDSSPCYLLIVHQKQQRSCVVLVLVLTLLTCISCWLPTLHLVDNAGLEKKKRKQATCHCCHCLFTDLMLSSDAEL